MGQVLILVPQFGEIAVVESVPLIMGGYGIKLQESCLSHKDGLHLKEVIAVVANGLQRYVHSPLLEGVAIDAEAVVTGQRHKVGVFP